MDYLDYSVLTWPFATYVVSSVNDFIAKTGKWLDKLSNPEHQFMKALKKFPFRTLVGAVDDGIVHPNSALVHLESHRDTCDSRIIPQGKFALHSL